MRFNLKRMAPWGSFVLASGLLLWLLANHWSSMTHPRPNTQPFGIFGTFWASGWAVRHHLNPYLEYPPFTWKPHAFGKNGPYVLDLNLNPPSTLPAFSVLSRIPPQIGACAWAVASTLLFIGIAAFLTRRYHPQRKQVWWLLTCGATIMTLALQQIYVLLLLGSVCAWVLLEEDRDVAAGIVLGVLASIKPNLALWPLLLALSGRLKPLLPASIVAIGLSVIPIFLYGPAVYSEWWQATGIDSHSIFPADVSIAGNFTRLGSRPTGLAVAAVLLILICCLVRARRPTLYETTGIALCASILCSPLGWMHYVLLLTPLLFAKRWTPLVAFAALLLWINPVFVDPPPYASHWSAFFRGLIYLIPMCILIAEFSRPALRTLTARWQPGYDLSPVRDSQ
jgi:hypothetical protein